MNEFATFLNDLLELLEMGRVRVTANRVLFDRNKRVVANPGEVLTVDQLSRAIGNIKSLDYISVQNLAGYSN